MKEDQIEMEYENDNDDYTWWIEEEDSLDDAEDDLPDDWMYDSDDEEQDHYCDPFDYYDYND